MSTIAEIAAQISPSTTTTSTTGGDDIGKTDFLNLLVAQMQNQDPLNPSDPTEFTSQLTQYSSLEQLMNVNTNLETMSGAQSLDAMVSAAGFVGKTAKMAGDEVELTTGGTATLMYDLPRDAEKVTINIKDEDGKVVRTTTLGAQDMGEQTYTWDGKVTNGDDAPSGTYTFEVKPLDANGDAITATPMVEGEITGVHFENGDVMLEMGNSAWALSNLISVH
jgi:flagellar basal-body rod modification protein FlgD